MIITCSTHCSSIVRHESIIIRHGAVWISIIIIIFIQLSHSDCGTYSLLPIRAHLYLPLVFCACEEDRVIILMVGRLCGYWTRRQHSIMNITFVACTNRSDHLLGMLIFCIIYPIYNSTYLTDVAHQGKSMFLTAEDNTKALALNMTTTITRPFLELELNTRNVSPSRKQFITD